MTLISWCPLPNYIFTFKWALFIRILTGVRTFYYDAKTSSIYKCLQLSTSFHKPLEGFLNQIFIKSIKIHKFN